MPFPAEQQKGFTLIEMAMVLVIIGILLSLGVGLMGPMTKRSKLIETREIMKAAQEAILGYAAARKSLPPDLNSLGVRTTDSYTRSLSYYPVSFPNLCTSTGAYLTVNDASAGGVPHAITNAAFILIADGDNRCNQTGSSSPFTIYAQAASGAPVPACPAGADYDDIVLYVGIDKLRWQICAPFSITTDSLPVGKVGVFYPPVTLGATDGAMPFAWVLTSGSLPTGLNLSGAGIISGTPAADGSYSFTARVEDNDTPRKIATKSFSITINP